MNSILSKLKTSATLWSVIASFVLGVVTLIWGDQSVAMYAATTLMAVVPSAVYIYSKFKLRISLADVNNDGKIDLHELAAALKQAATETSAESQEVLDAVCDVVVAIAEQEDQEKAPGI